MFDDTIVKILGNSYSNTPIKTFTTDVQDYTATINKEDYDYKCTKLLFVDYIEPLMQENYYLSINNKFYKIIKVDTYSEHLEVYLYFCEFKDVKVNEIDKKILIEETTEKISTIDEKIIVSNFEVKTGGFIDLQSKKWLVTSEIAKDSDTFRSRIRKCNNSLKYKATIDGVNGVVEIPAIIDKGTVSISEGKYFATVDNQLNCQVGYSMIDKIKHIKVGFRFVLNNSTWKVMGIDNISRVAEGEQGIVVIKLESTAKLATDNFDIGIAYNSTPIVITTT